MYIQNKRIVVNDDKIMVNKMCNVGSLIAQVSSPS